MGDGKTISKGPNTFVLMLFDAYMQRSGVNCNAIVLTHTPCQDKEHAETVGGMKPGDAHDVGIETAGRVNAKPWPAKGGTSLARHN